MSDRGKKIARAMQDIAKSEPDARPLSYMAALNFSRANQEKVIGAGVEEAASLLWELLSAKNKEPS